MFEFLFKYPPTVFQKGSLVLLGGWPSWVLGVFIVLAAIVLAYPIWRRRWTLRAAGVWLLQTLFVSILLLLLWHPAVSVATLRPQQNIVAVLVDDSRSMGLKDGGATSRREQAASVLQNTLLKELPSRFQVRLYRLGAGLERIEKPDVLSGALPATRLGPNLQQVVAEGNSLPIGAVVLLSDGADNSGGVDLQTLSAIRRQRIPIYTVGFGPEQPKNDVEVREVQLPTRVLTGSRVSADVSFVQYGMAGKRARVTVRDGARLLASQEVTLRGDGQLQTESLGFQAGSPGPKNLQVGVDPVAGETNGGNNALTRTLSVSSAKPRILYIEGEPRWEFKFIRRAAEEDQTLQLVTMLRTTQNKIYRQGVSNPKELEEGFPGKVEELFGYQGLIVGGVEAGYFTPAQQELIKQFVDRRGGGVLFLGGRAGLSDGGVGKSALAEIVPVTLPDRTGTFHRDPATVELTKQGRESLLTRLEEDPARNVERWKKLPVLANYQEVGAAKPGAVTLAEMRVGNQKLPFLVTENFGRGRSALLATAGTWRWQMTQPLEDKTHEMFWAQMLRWLVTETPGPVVSGTVPVLLQDDGQVALRAEVRDKTFLPAADAAVEARVIGPNGTTETVKMRPDPQAEGAYLADWTAPATGDYVAEIVASRDGVEVGRDTAHFRREDGVAEQFHTNQNRELLEKLSQQTGGQYYQPDQARRLVQDITYSDAGLTVRENKDLWDMPIVFFLALLLRSGEWLLRRKWGTV